jgi:hypothetical protein
MPEINVTVETNPSPSLSFSTSTLPEQTGHAGKLLATNGSTASWTNEPSLKSLRITDGVYPYVQLANNSAPTDKKRLRAYVETSGTVGLARTNDAENVGVPLATWDVNNNCGISQGAPQAKLHVGGGVVASPAFSTAEIFRAEWSNGNNSTLRLLQVRNSTGGDWTTTTTRLQQFTDTTPQGFIEFNPAGLNYGVALGATNGSNVNAPVLFLTGAAGGNNVGIGTTSTPEKLSVNGNIRFVNNGALIFTDQSGTTPYMVAAVDGNFYFTGTGSTGAGRSIFRCGMRSDSSPLQIDAPLKIGAAGVPLISVLKATVSHNIGTLAAGAFLELTSTVTGAIAGAIVQVGDGSPFNLIVRGYVATGDTVSVMYHNPTAASINAGTRSIDLFVFNAI